MHARCEGIVLLDGEDLPEIYECKSCLGFGKNDQWLRGTLKAAKKLFEDEIHEINTEMRQLKMKIETLEDVTLKCGVRHGELKRACKNMKLDPSKYHGGDFEGKVCVFGSVIIIIIIAIIIITIAIIINVILIK